MTKKTVSKILVPIIGMLALFPFATSAGALVAGILIAVFFGNPYPTKKYTHRLLAFSVVGLGAGMNLDVVLRAGIHGFGYTLVSILVIFALGLLLTKLFKVEEEVALLITVGTAICGGSAIAAVTPVLRARPASVSVALGVVFILNAIALIVFPTIGHSLNLSERAFGLWSALAIHDTSSVVGATVSYGKEAAEIGTTVKLTRALWIVPLVLIIGWIKNKGEKATVGAAKKPWFIFGFIIAAAIVTWMPSLQAAGRMVEFLAKRTLILTLFFIGLELSRDTLRKVGLKPLVLGVVLWLLISIGSLSAIQLGLIE